jgi:uncharacterized protein YndB with AHSA1/START domain
MQERTIRKEAVVNGSAKDVWDAWTTSKGAEAFFAPRANINLDLGGPYELLFDLDAPEGSRGSEGMKILSFLPIEMLSFDWNAPPQYPSVRRGQHTWVVVQFYPIKPNQTRVRLTHIGWKEGEEWDKVYQYFKRAWDVVLGSLEYRFSTGPIDWNDRYNPPKDRTYEVRKD